MATESTRVPKPGPGDRLDLVVVHLVVAPLDIADAQHLDHWLHRARRTLEERNGRGHRDDLVLVGVGFRGIGELRARLGPFGLVDAEMLVIDADDEVLLDDGALDVDALGRAMARTIGKWLGTRRPAAIPLAAPPPSLRGVDYGDNPWWIGLHVATDGEHVDAIAKLQTLLPSPFCEQSSTWLGVLEAVLKVTRTPLCDLDEFDYTMTMAALARWLSGFVAALESATLIDQGEAMAAAGVSDFRLGFEAARVDVDGVDAELAMHNEWAARNAAFLGLLRSGRYLSGSQLREFFGGSTALLYTTYASFRPELSRPAWEASDNLVKLRSIEMADLDAPWRFVDRDDWSDLE